MRLGCLLIIALSIGAMARAEEPTTPLAVIDVHLHAGPAQWTGPGAPSDPANETHRRNVLLEMDRNNVRLAVISGPIEFVEYWKNQAPERFVASPLFPCDGGVAPLDGRRCFPSGSAIPDLMWLRGRYASGIFGAMGEITAQYAGLSPADATLEPCYALAEEIDVPVGIHTGISDPGTPYKCCPKFRAEFGRPLLMEEILIRHPRLRVYAMHAGGPYVEEMLAMMHLYPQLYVDISAIPKPLVHSQLRRFVEHGFDKRILFGSDDLPMRECIGSIESAAFLSQAQKADILCVNAARFLRLDASTFCKEAGRAR